MPTFSASDGCNLFFTDEGEGLPILCLSGLTRNHQDFDHVTPHLVAKGARVIRMDYRGRGNSDWPGPETYTVPKEAQDALELLDHLGLERAAVLGTSRGGLIAMGLGATAKGRLLGVALNDIGPDISDEGLEDIKGYLGRKPSAKTFDAFLPLRAKAVPGFANVPEERWRHDLLANFEETEDGLAIRYDARLRDAVLASDVTLNPDLWPFFDALDGLPLALIRGANSNLLAEETAAQMRARRPDMIFANVPDRGHVPFLDEPEALSALTLWLEKMQ
ncbi:MAG: alpha/beta hydrolase [Rhodobacterales bacterium]|nr:MAG: alpha/beta hydrolase [Rhodobacterales bacterium]